MYMQLPFAGTMPRKYTKKTDRVRTPLDVLTRANEAVAQGGNYRRVAKEFSIERMQLKLNIWIARSVVDQYYGLSVVKCRCLAHEFARKNNVNMPDN